ncbi:hypothetical protein ACHAWF_002175, partial [Thalassiosira exigua]
LARLAGGRGSSLALPRLAGGADRGRGRRPLAAPHLRHFGVQHRGVDLGGLGATLATALPVVLAFLPDFREDTVLDRHVLVRLGHGILVGLGRRPLPGGILAGVAVRRGALPRLPEGLARLADGRGSSLALPRLAGGADRPRLRHLGHWGVDLGGLGPSSFAALVVALGFFARLREGAGPENGRVSSGRGGSLVRLGHGILVRLGNLPLSFRRFGRGLGRLGLARLAEQRRLRRSPGGLVLRRGLRSWICRSLSPGYDVLHIFDR